MTISFLSFILSTLKKDKYEKKDVSFLVIFLGRCTRGRNIKDREIEKDRDSETDKQRQRKIEQ